MLYPPEPMNAEDQTTPTARAAELLSDRPQQAQVGQGSLRARLRGLLLRAMRPHTHRQHLLDLELLQALRAQEAELAAVRERDGERIERLEQLVVELIHTAESLRRAGGATATRVGELNALPYIEDSPFASLQTPVGEALGFDSRRLAGDDSEYVAFEDLFRGSGERVRRSQRPYLALLHDHSPVLDIGCGRGEMLALLEEAGIPATGVDSDDGMVARCRAAGLDVAFGDAAEHLRGLRDGSLGAVFSAQVIEHLPFQTLRELLALSLEKLRPGGLFIAETVNPHRISSLKTFWVDLTHQHPIFPEVALALCGIAGYESAYVFLPGYESFREGVFESPAYAVVAEAPGQR
jgi:SAM-dependent methyltransferase